MDTTTRNVERRGDTALTFGPVTALVALVALRIMTSWNWLNGAFFGTDAKVNPEWLNGDGLVKRIGGPGGFAEKALYPWIGDFIRNDIASTPALWAWLIFLGYAFAGLSLLFGFLTRLGGLVAVLCALMNLLGAGGNGADTIGQNGLLLVLGATFMLTGAGRVYGVDRWLLERFPMPWLRFVA